MYIVRNVYVCHIVSSPLKKWTLHTFYVKLVSVTVVLDFVSMIHIVTLTAITAIIFCGATSLN